MAELIHQQRRAVAGSAGREYDVMVYAERVDGHWEAHVEFRPSGGGLVLRTRPDARHPSRDAVVAWAAALPGGYFETAFERAFDQASE